MKLRFREYGSGDLAALGRMFDRADRHDGVARALSPAAADGAPFYAFAPRFPLGLERGLTLSEARSRLGNRVPQLERHILVAADDAAVFACVAVYPAGSDARWMLDWVVDPERRGAVPLDGLIEAGLERIAMLAAEGCDSSRNNAATARCNVEARGLREDAEVSSALGRAGLSAARTFAILARDLNDAPEAGESIRRPPAGIQLRSYRAGDALAWIAAFNAAFSDHWGGFSYTEESWGRHTASPRFRNRISVVAEAGDALAGICHCAPSLNPREKGLAHLHILGVPPQFRRRGLGTCLMLEALGRLRESGFSRVELDMDSLNSRALPIYEQLGFREQEAITMYRREIKV